MSTNSKTLAVDGADLHGEVYGEGEPLLLLHGLTGTGQDWKHVLDLPALAAQYRLIVLDARGHGRSTNPSGNCTFQRWGLDVVAWLDHLEIERARAVGMSLGAKTLLHVATTVPERVSSMIVVSATPRFPEATRAIFRDAAAAAHTQEEWTAMRAQHIHGDDQIRALWQLPAHFADDPSDMSFSSRELGAISARTLIVSGDRDPLYPVELAIELYRGIPKSRLYVVPGGGHGPIFEKERGPFVERALEFLLE